MSNHLSIDDEDELLAAMNADERKEYETWRSVKEKYEARITYCRSEMKTIRRKVRRRVKAGRL